MWYDYPELYSQPRFKGLDKAAVAMGFLPFFFLFIPFLLASM